MVSGRVLLHHLGFRQRRLSRLPPKLISKRQFRLNTAQISLPSPTFSDPDEKTASTYEVLNCLERVERMEQTKSESWKDYSVNTDGNPWEFPPAAVAIKGRESIRTYYDTWEQCDFSLIEIHALKVVFVGAYGAGKTR